MNTPNGSLVVIIDQDGNARDATELVMLAYDTATNSMDWGSGFLSTEEANQLQLLARICGFDWSHYKDEAVPCKECVRYAEDVEKIGKFTGVTFQRGDIVCIAGAKEKRYYRYDYRGWPQVELGWIETGHWVKASTGRPTFEIPEEDE